MTILNMKIILFLILFYTCLANNLSHDKYIVGGYKNADRHGDRIKEVAKFAVKTLSDSDSKVQYKGFNIQDSTQVDISVIHAQQQVVAGVNYRLTLEIKDEDGECMGVFDVDIYDRFGELIITSWGGEYSCEEAKAMKIQLKAAENED
eukprot:CAMPEP_0194232390 /NCGR_PEP_ID=MMETSP0158-20130606/779_1 /TAXON_ID=33649 /ORGANISM="Thalassionema nitzschioides, Strain L26-B" /LENGTH=147 /DNA_ID=CAMNT_0038965143 /DNA_START=52 /DNA_END=495 /DNA_ORIENTATION=-